ncbi:hypothetical protein AB1N83_011851 [Pleurotus pulmonarius]
MTAFNKFFTAVFLAVTYASVSQAVLFDQDVKHATHRTREIGQSLKVEVFHPPTSYMTFGNGVSGPLLRGGDLKSQTITAVRQRLGVDESSVTFKSGYSQSSEAFEYVKQQHNNIFCQCSCECRVQGQQVSCVRFLVCQAKEDSLVHPQHLPRTCLFHSRDFIRRQTQ